MINISDKHVKFQILKVGILIVLLFITLTIAFIHAPTKSDNKCNIDFVIEENLNISYEVINKHNKCVIIINEKR